MAADKIQAFEKYYALTKTGIKPSVAVTTIANELDVSTRAVYKWKKKYEWDKRATERSIKANKELAETIKEESDKAVKDMRTPYIKILNGLIGKCMRANEIQINNVRDLIQVMQLSVQLQKELDMQDVHIISAEYSREKHVKEINTVLSKLKAREDEELKQEYAEKEGNSDESGLHKTKILDPRQTDLRANSLG